MQTLSKKPAPPFVILEQPAKNLDGLTAGDELLALVDLVCRQWTKPDRVAELGKYGISPIRQLLFYGPPGNGKTSAAQWIGKKLDMPVYRVRVETLVHRFVGSTASNVGELIDWLRSAGKAIVLFDEIETIFLSREAGESSAARELQAAMTVLWQSLDRWTSPQLFIFATNMPQRLDPAFMSRMEAKLEFGPPTAEQQQKVIAYWAEIFHAYGAEQWAPELASEQFESFRELWQAISNNVRNVALA